MSPHGRREPLIHALLARPVLRTGALTGGLLILVMLVALFVANRVPAFEAFAPIRNAICYGVFALIMAIPVCRFLLLPRRLFASAVIGWLLFTLGFILAGFYFTNLYVGLGRTPLQVFLLGVIVYSIVAVLSWVVWMIQIASRHSIASSHRRARQTSHQR